MSGDYWSLIVKKVLVYSSPQHCQMLIIFLHSATSHLVVNLWQSHQ